MDRGWLSLFTLLRGGGEDSRVALWRGGVIDLETDLVKLLPLSTSFPLLFRCGVPEGERRRSTPRLWDGNGDLDLEYEDPV